MTTSENNIVTKLTSEIESAASTERKTLIGDLYTFLGAVEKRITLSAVGGSLAADAQTAVGAVERAAEKVGGEIKAVL